MLAAWVEDLLLTEFPSWKEHLGRLGTVLGVELEWSEAKVSALSKLTYVPA